MAINKKLIHFTNKTNFLNEYNNGNILPTSIVFILDAKQIWTHNEFYSCPFTEEEINQLLVGSNIKLNGYTEITSPIEISAADTVNQAFGKIEDYLNSMINDYISPGQLSSILTGYVSDSELASKNYATKQDVADLVDGAPETLDTLNELAAALKDNAGIVDVLNESIGSKLSKTEAAENYATKVDLEAASIKWSILGKSELYEWVDLGLPSGLKWAAWNVGATKPEEFGLYFAWGETQGYSGITAEKGFYWGDYKFSSGQTSPTSTSFKGVTKYNNNSASGVVDNLTILEQVDDAAYQSDNTCRMPTKADLEELTANTTSTWETLNGVNGRRFTSNTNGNSIFVPAAGICNYGSVYDVGSYGSLWSSSLYESNSRNAWGLDISSSNMYMDDYYRRNGYSVRAVKF